MKVRHLFIGITLILSAVYPLLGQLSDFSSAEKMILQHIEKNKLQYEKTALAIWELAELGFQEEKSTLLLQELLKNNGFNITTGQEGMSTAFIAEYGKGKPIIGFLAEFDALPGLSQKVSTNMEPLVERAPGHACGHHLFGTGSIAAAISLKEWMTNEKMTGTIRVYGTPAEEGGGGKVFMARAGLLDDVDAVLTWHPASKNDASAESSLAIISAKFTFKGVSAHAAMAPWRGRSALDGVEAMNDMVNMMREHVEPDARIHYAITNGSMAPNVVPSKAEVYYIVRHPETKEVMRLFERLKKCAKGAAIGTETEVSEEIVSGYYNILINETLSRLMYQKLSKLGGITYSAQEKAFATELIQSFPQGNYKPEDAMKIEKFRIEDRGGPASSDVGDVSWVTPTASIATATWVPGTVAHSWQAVASGGSSIGISGMMLAAKTMAISALELLTNNNILQKAKEEKMERAGADFKYKSLVGDRLPPFNFMSGNDPRKN
jgi:aminobenzoyl-glutamate utilization protein B